MSGKHRLLGSLRQPGSASLGSGAVNPFTRTSSMRMAATAEAAAVADAAAAAADGGAEAPLLALQAELAALRDAAAAAAEGQALAAARRAAVADAELERLTEELAASKRRCDELDWRLKAMRDAAPQPPSDGARSVAGTGIMNALLGPLVAACTAPRAPKPLPPPAKS
jgi:hypothetical protein